MFGWARRRAVAQRCGRACMVYHARLISLGIESALAGRIPTKKEIEYSVFWFRAAQRYYRIASGQKPFKS